MAVNRTKDWRSVIRFLRSNFPIDTPVTVVRSVLTVRGKEDKATVGFTTFNGFSFRVVISSSQRFASQVDTLIHEWAHVVAIDEAYGHRGRWGEIYGKVYDTWNTDFNGGVK